MLKTTLAPKSIAFIGASSTPGKLGFDILSNIKHLGYKGKIYPVNPKGQPILGLKTYTSIRNLPEIPDLVLVAIPASTVNKTIQECGKHGIKNITIISAGFKEVGGEGVQREKDLQNIIQKYGICLIGPNCLGIINTDIDMNASFAEGMPNKGNVSLISQSGAMAVAIIDWAYESGVGFSKIISMGNKAGVTENDLLEYLGNDSKTKVILMYLESIADGKNFMKIARKVSLKKPIIIVKSGTSEAGTKAISSHTGSLAGSDIAVSTAFEQTGIIRAESTQELFDFAKAFSAQQPPKGKRVGIITNAGGPGIMATDALSTTTLKLADISKQTQEKLSKGLPQTASLHNPVDVIGDAPAKRYQHAAQTLLESNEIDSLLVVLTPQIMTEVKKVAEITTSLAHQYPEQTVMSVFMGGESVRRGYTVFRRNHFPNFVFPSRAILALDHMYQYAEWKKHEKNRLRKKEVQKKVLGRKKLDAIFASKKSGERFSPHEIETLMNAYGIKCPKMQLAKTEKEGCQFAKKIGYPVVMKIASPEIYHKTDAGGIRIDIENEKELKSAWQEILDNVKTYNPKAKIEGITIEPMVPIGKEVIIGAKKDPQFGHMLMFGLGGIYVEILKDVTFRIAPITKNEAMHMVEEIKTIELLKGARGEKPVDIKNIAEVIERVGQIMMDYPQIQEFEINPLIVCPRRGTFAVDVNCIV